MEIDRLQNKYIIYKSVEFVQIIDGNKLYHAAQPVSYVDAQAKVHMLKIYNLFDWDIVEEGIKRFKATYTDVRVGQEHQCKKAKFKINKFIRSIRPEHGANLWIGIDPQMLK